MLKTAIKVILLLIILGLCWNEFLVVLEISAYYNDSETSSGSRYSAGILDFYLTANEWTPAKIVSEMLPGDTVIREISVINEGNLAFQYIVKTQIVEGSDKDFCDILTLKAQLEGTVIYSNGLKDFNLENSPILISGDRDDWNLRVNLPKDISHELQGKSCQFKFVFDGWQDNLKEKGFSDTEEMENILESGFWISYTSEYSPIADAHIDQYFVNRNYGSSSILRIKSKNFSNNRSFVRFDFHFPERTTIISSFLKLFMHRPPVLSREYEIKRVVEDWKEKDPGGITWKNQPTVAEKSTDLILSGTFPGWLSWEVTSDVQGFVDGTYQNYGWRVSDTQENSSISYLAKFRSRESSFADQRPILEVSFISPEPNTPYPVINEVYYHVGTGRGCDPKNEWVEIYNPTNSEIDISGWKICDRWGCDTIPHLTLIPAKSFAIITPTNSTWDYWKIPEKTIKIVLGSSIGSNGLGNRGDRVILKDTSNRVIDTMSYGFDTSQFNLPLSGRGKSLARIVKGYDTNSAIDWVINARPNPGSNPSENGIEVIRFTFEGIEVVNSELQNLNPLPIEEESIEEEIVSEDLLKTETDFEETATFIKGEIFNY